MVVGTKGVTLKSIKVWSVLVPVNDGNEVKTFFFLSEVMR
jgi:hypothetical protein